jgi:hypothetical protein
MVGVCVEQTGAPELERRAMNSIDSRFDRGLRDGAAGASKFCWSRTRIHAKFLRTFDIREKVKRIHQRLIVVDAVENIVVGLRPKPVGR